MRWPSRASSSPWRGLKQDLRATLGPTGILERIGEDHVFATLPTAVEAFRRWQGDHPAAE